jgi:hypothetical protein
MRFLRRVVAEVMLLSPRLTRTRFGTSLLLLGLALLWLRSRGLDPLTAVLQAGALGAVIGAAWIAGSARDRASLATALTHPTTPLAIATGRWVAIVLPAAARHGVRRGNAHRGRQRRSRDPHRYGRCRVCARDGPACRQ